MSHKCKVPLVFSQKNKKNIIFKQCKHKNKVSVIIKKANKNKSNKKNKKIGGAERGAGEELTVGELAIRFKAFPTNIMYKPISIVTTHGEQSLHYFPKIPYDITVTLECDDFNYRYSYSTVGHFPSPAINYDTILQQISNYSGYSSMDIRGRVLRLLVNEKRLIVMLPKVISDSGGSMSASECISNVPFMCKHHFFTGTQKRQHEGTVGMNLFPYTELEDVCNEVNISSFPIQPSILQNVDALIRHNNNSSISHDIEGELVLFVERKDETDFENCIPIMKSNILAMCLNSESFFRFSPLIIFCVLIFKGLEFLLDNYNEIIDEKVKEIYRRLSRLKVLLSKNILTLDEIREYSRIYKGLLGMFLETNLQFMVRHTVVPQSQIIDATFDVTFAFKHTEPFILKCNDNDMVIFNNMSEFISQFLVDAVLGEKYLSVNPALIQYLRSTDVLNMDVRTSTYMPIISWNDFKMALILQKMCDQGNTGDNEFAVMSGLSLSSFNHDAPDEKDGYINRYKVDFMGMCGCSVTSTNTRGQSVNKVILLSAKQRPDFYKDNAPAALSGSTTSAQGWSVIPLALLTYILEKKSIFTPVHLDTFTHIRVITPGLSGDINNPSGSSPDNQPPIILSPLTNITTPIGTPVTNFVLPTIIKEDNGVKLSFALSLGLINPDMSTKSEYRHISEICTQGSPITKIGIPFKKGSEVIYISFNGLDKDRLIELLCSILTPSLPDPLETHPQFIQCIKKALSINDGTVPSKANITSGLMKLKIGRTQFWTLFIEAVNTTLTSSNILTVSILFSAFENWLLTGGGGGLPPGGLPPGGLPPGGGGSNSNNEASNAAFKARHLAVKREKNANARRLSRKSDIRRLAEKYPQIYKLGNDVAVPSSAAAAATPPLVPHQTSNSESSDSENNTGNRGGKARKVVTASGIVIKTERDGLTLDQFMDWVRMPDPYRYGNEYNTAQLINKRDEIRRELRKLDERAKLSYLMRLFSNSNTLVLKDGKLQKGKRLVGDQRLSPPEIDDIVVLKLEEEEEAQYSPP